MTGFGRGAASAEGWHAVVELSAVNRKQAEVVVQLPKELAELEARVRQAVLQVVARGRVQASVRLERTNGMNTAMHIDATAARAFDAMLQELGRTLGRTIEPTAADFLRQPGVFIDPVAMAAGDAWRVVGPALDQALAALVAMRDQEGNHLRQDLAVRLSAVETLVRRIAADAPVRPARQREALLKRLREADIDIDLGDERALKELALFADRCDISEELTRLESHIVKFRTCLDADNPPGRALDFLCQELFREFNTIASKANDADMTHTVVEAKTLLETIREQAQNVE
jgi:uncharacterized protein (TIGR00255 family)